MSLIFCTTCSAAYGKAYIFPTLSHLSCRAVCLLEPHDDRYLASANAEVVRWTSDRFYQSGGLIGQIPGLLPDDVVMLSDADVVVQRDLSDAERALLEIVGDGFMAGANRFPGQLGLNELEILQLDDGFGRGLQPNDGDRFGRRLVQMAEALRLPLAAVCECQMRNWGLVAAKASSWERLDGLYREHVRDVNPQQFFLYPTWLQYVLCCILHHHKIPLHDMPLSLHSHGHFELTPEHNCWKGQLLYRDEVVFVAHWIAGVTHG